MLKANASVGLTILNFVQQTSYIQTSIMKLFAAYFLTLIFGAQAADFTIEDVAQHSSNNDCWSVVESTVYDVTAYGMFLSRFQYHVLSRAIARCPVLL